MATADLERPAVAAEAKREPEVNKLFRMVMKHEGSDLHLKVGLPPMMRLKGVIRQMELPPISGEQMERLLYPIMSERAKRIFEETEVTGFVLDHGRGSRRVVGVQTERGDPGHADQRPAHGGDRGQQDIAPGHPPAPVHGVDAHGQTPRSAPRCSTTDVPLAGDYHSPARFPPRQRAR